MLRRAAVLCVAMGLSFPTQAQQDVSSTLSRLLQCQLTHQELDNFTDRIAAGDLTDFSQSKKGNGAALMLWEARAPVMAWGESSTLVHVSGVQEMLLAIPVPVGEEMERGDPLRTISGVCHRAGMPRPWKECMAGKDSICTKRSLVIDMYG